MNLEAIKARAEAATTGPWQNAPDTGAGRVWVQRHPQKHWGKIQDAEPLFNVRGPEEYAQRAADAEFIAHAREDVPALVAEVERLRQPVSDDKRAAISHVLADFFGSSAAIRHEVTSEIIRILSIDESQDAGNSNGAGS